MSASKTTQPRRKQCPTCKGTGEVSRTVHVGRKRRAVGHQTGICLTCLGACEIPADD